MLTVDIEKIRSASTKLDYGNRQLKGTRNVIDTIEIPKDFIYSGELKRISAKLRSIAKKFDEIKKWMTTSANRFSKSENKNENVVNEINKNIFTIDFENLIHQYGTPEQIAQIEGQEALKEEQEQFMKTLYMPLILKTKDEVGKAIKNSVKIVINTIPQQNGKEILAENINEIFSTLPKEIDTVIENSISNLYQKMKEEKTINQLKNYMQDGKEILSEDINEIFSTLPEEIATAAGNLISNWDKNVKEKKVIDQLKNYMQGGKKILSENISESLSTLPKEIALTLADVISTFYQNKGDNYNMNGNVNVNVSQGSSVKAANNSKFVPSLEKVITSIKQKDTNEYKLVFSKKIKTKLIKEYKINEKDANIFMKLIKANKNKYNKVIEKIVSKYENKEKEFKKIFGFALYKKNSDGEKVLNYTELLVDVFYVGNLSLNGAELLTKDKNENVIINKRAYEIKDGKIVSTKLSGTSPKNVSEYIKANQNKKIDTKDKKVDTKNKKK